MGRSAYRKHNRRLCVCFDRKKKAKIIREMRTKKNKKVFRLDDMRSLYISIPK